MFGDGELDDEGQEQNLRGRLSEVYFPALLGGARERLTKRLGSRATIDFPALGRANGLAELEQHLEKVSEWLRGYAATFSEDSLVVGIDRDVTEGTLSLQVDSQRIALPVAVVAERRKNREVELRVYHSTRLLTGKAMMRALLGPSANDLPLPKLVAEHLDAMKTGSVDATLACFESDGIVRDAHGKKFSRADATLREHCSRLLVGGARSGLDVQRGGYADNGRVCALEVSLLRIAGDEVSANANLFVYERGNNGLVHALRIYGDLDP